MFRNIRGSPNEKPMTFGAYIKLVSHLGSFRFILKFPFNLYTRMSISRIFQLKKTLMNQIKPSHKITKVSADSSFM